MKPPLFVSIPGRFILALRFVVCLILLWGLALPAQAQVVVKERVEITSEGVPVTASASKQSSSDRRGPLKRDWTTRGRIITRTGYLTIAYVLSQWANTAPEGEIRIEVWGDSLLRTVTDSFGPANFDQQSTLQRSRCDGQLTATLETYSNAGVFDFNSVFAADSLGLIPESARFDVGRVFPGDSLVMTIVTESGPHVTGEREASSEFTHEHEERRCEINESEYRYESLLVNAFFEWTVDHFEVSGPSPSKPVLPNDSTNFTVSARHEDDSIAEFDLETMVRMELDAEGARLGHLRGQDGTTGASLEISYEEANTGKVWYFANDSDPAVIFDPSQVTLTVTQIDDEVITGELEYYVGGHTFSVVVEPDTVDFGETGRVTIIAIDTDSTQVNLPEATPLIIATQSNTLIAPDSSVLGPFLFEIPYGQARSGLVRFKTTDPVLLLSEPTLLEEDLFTIYFHPQSGVAFDGLGTVTTRNDPRLELDYDRDPKSYLPIRNDVIEVTATITPPPPPGSMVTFELVQADDFTFADSTVAPKMEPVVGKEAKVMLKSQEYWGVVKVKATLARAGKDDLDDEQQLPLDTDNDGIADSWELDPANGGTLAKGGSNQDGNWDDETSPGNTNDGDGFTKLGEYQGVMIGMDHQRMTPEKKEVFLDVRNASGGAYAVGEIETQLDIKVHVVEGIDLPFTPFPGPRPLKWLGVSAFRGYSGYAHVENAGVPHSAASPTPKQQHENGEVVQGNIYALSGTKSQPSASYGGHIFGDTQGDTAGGGARIRVFNGVIANIWTNNDISESENTTFRYPVAEPFGPNKGLALWTSRYRRNDIDNNGNVGDPINPFDLLSSGSTNAAIDGSVAGLAQQRYVEFNTLHELGHALGIATKTSCPRPDPRYHCHPLNGSSIMRSGFGPAKVVQFSPDEIKQMKLK